MTHGFATLPAATPRKNLRQRLYLGLANVAGAAAGLGLNALIF